MKKTAQLGLFEFQNGVGSEGFDNLEHYFIHCIHTSGFPLHKIATALNLSPSGLSKRLNMFPNDNDPRFNLRDVDSYIRFTKDLRIKKYLEDLEKKFSETEDEKRKRISKELEQAYLILKRIFEH